MLPGTIKRQFSTAFVEAIEPVLHENMGFYQFEHSEGAMLRISDSDPLSDYHYSIVNEEWAEGSVHVTFERKPWSTHDAKRAGATCKLAQFPATLKGWFELVRRHQKQSILDDPRLWGYEEEFHREYKLADDDADTATFNYEQQLLLDRYFEVVSEGLEGMRDAHNTALIDELKSDAQNAKEALTKETKNSVMKRIGRLWAKTRLAGLKYYNWMVKTFVDGLIKAGGGAAFKWVSENIHRLPHLIEDAKGLIESHGPH
jgi:hypothetical protein